jgi:hypothetical protein
MAREQGRLSRVANALVDTPVDIVTDLLATTGSVTRMVSIVAEEALIGSQGELLDAKIAYAKKHFDVEASLEEMSLTMDQIEKLLGRK